jgi:peptide/nickel transport system ATP-binding protein
MSEAPVLRVRDLRVEVAGSGADIVGGVGFDLARGEVMGLVGESGCGKTAVAMALLGHARPGTRIAGGSIRLTGTELVGARRAVLRRVRGAGISYVPQDPTRSLSPRRRILWQIEEGLRAHGHDPAAERGRVRELMETVMLPSTDAFLDRFPYQLSGGQQQRVVLVMALVCRPDVVVLDEPTTGLDVTTQARILVAIARLRDASGCGFVHVTHDLAVVASLADRIGVMYAGRLVEVGPAAAVVRGPRHPYTARLLASTPRIHDPTRPEGMPGTAPAPGARPPGCSFAPRCTLAEPACEAAFPAAETVGEGHQVRCRRHGLTAGLAAAPAPAAARPAHTRPFLEVEDLAAWYGRHRDAGPLALAGVSLAIREGECLAVVGESGSGKSTLARCIAGLHPAHAGRIRLKGRPLHPVVRLRPGADMRAVQLVYQNPDRSLNPRRTVADQIGRPIALFGLAAGRDLDRAVAGLLDRVRLPQAAARRYPPELSGGEKQRVAVARALAAQPVLLLCDEVTSSLDVSVQAAVLELLDDLRRDRPLTLLYISHDLGVVATMADRILVLKEGTVREEGTTRTIITAARDPYTRELIAASPELPA